jgi:hypothetical protein
MRTCPKCLKTTRIASAIHGMLRIFLCTHCGQGWKTGINGTKSYNDEIIINFGYVMDGITVQVGKNKIKLPALARSKDDHFTNQVV